MRRIVAGVLVLVLPALGLLASGASSHPHGYEGIIDLAFPVSGRVSYSDDYHAWRGGGTRRHQGTDIFAPKLSFVFAAVGGEICRMAGISEPVRHGYLISVCADDGRRYHYVHLNNDRPGTDDGAGGTGWAYAPGLRPGVRVVRGQWLGFLGDSGNAEDTPAHLHFEIEDPGLDDARIATPPYLPVRMNPYPSLVHAQLRGDVGGGVLRVGARGQQVLDWQQQLHLGDPSLAVDGIFGQQTLTATTAFQAEHDIAADGVVGQQTRHALARALAAPAVAAAGSPGPDVAAGDSPPWPGRYLAVTDPLLRGEDVRRWQQRMHDRGWRLAVDGVYGPESARVCRGFQEEKGLAVDAVVGPRTWAAAFSRT